MRPRRRREADGAAPSTAPHPVAAARIQGRERMARRLQWESLGAERLQPPPGLGSGPVPAGRNRGPIRGDATRPAPGGGYEIRQVERAGVSSGQQPGSSKG